MKNQYTYFSYFILLLFLFGFQINSNAQTYATPELKTQAEKWEKEKNNKVDNSVIITEIAKIKTQPAFNFKLLKDAFKLQKVEAIDYSGKHTETEMEAFRKEAQGEFDAKDYGVDFNKNILYIIRRNDATKYRIMEFEKVDNYLQAKDCKDCQDNSYKIITNTPTSLILELKPQDEGQYFVCRFTFSK